MEALQREIAAELKQHRCDPNTDPAQAVKTIDKTRKLPAELSLAVSEALCSYHPGDKIILEAVTRCNFPAFNRVQLAQKIKAHLGSALDQTPYHFEFCAELLAALSGPVAADQLVKQNQVVLAELAPLVIRAENASEARDALQRKLFTSLGQPSRAARALFDTLPWMAERLAPFAPPPGKSLFARALAYLHQCSYTMKAAAILVALVLFAVAFTLVLALRRPTGQAATTTQAQSSLPAPPTLLEALAKGTADKEQAKRLRPHTVVILPHPHAEKIEELLTGVVDRVVPVYASRAAFGPKVPARITWLQQDDLKLLGVKLPETQEKILIVNVEPDDQGERMAFYKAPPMAANFWTVHGRAHAASQPPTTAVFLERAERLAHRDIKDARVGLNVRLARASAANDEELGRTSTLEGKLAAAQGDEGAARTAFLDAQFYFLPRQHPVEVLEVFRKAFPLGPAVDEQVGNSVIFKPKPPIKPAPAGPSPGGSP